MNIDVLVAEIGSTTTMVNAFQGIGTDRPHFLGQGFAPTSVLDGDVRIGLDGAVDSLKGILGTETLDWGRFLATSSAAGGLRMTVHGLVYDMTVRAGREAALGAGANIHHVTAGKLRPADLEKIAAIKPNIILIAGGVDYGERETALFNAKALSGLLNEKGFDFPVIYAGNSENRDEVKQLFEKDGRRLYTVENVYPRIDDLNIEPTRRVIQEVFEQHITGGPGMEYIRERVDGPIIPTPGGVMLAAQTLREAIGDLLVIDVGGATTDIHSVTAGSEEVNRILTSPEPEAKRTVEGDLGTYVNRMNVLKEEEFRLSAQKAGCTVEALRQRIASLPPIPFTDGDIKTTEILAESAALQALRRHAGVYRSLYGPEGKRDIAEGKDLTAVMYIIATGGALTRLPHRKGILKGVLSRMGGNTLAPPDNAVLLFDSEYTMASLGVLAREYPEAAVKLLKESIWQDR